MGDRWGDWKHFWFLIALIALGFGTLFAVRWLW